MASGKARTMPFEPFSRRLSAKPRAPECGIIHSLHSEETFRPPRWAERRDSSLSRLLVNAFPPHGAIPPDEKAQTMPFGPFLRRLSLNSQAPECGIIHSSHSCATFRPAALRCSTHSAPPARGRAARPGRRVAARPSAGGRGSASTRRGGFGWQTTFSVCTKRPA